jgi:hypothetical protein
MDRDKEQVVEEQEKAVPAGHHYAAPEVEEWQPHPYELEGVGRKESLKGDVLPEPKTQDTDKRE